MNPRKRRKKQRSILLASFCFVWVFESLAVCRMAAKKEVFLKEKRFYKERIASFLKPSEAPRSKFSVGMTNDRFSAKLIRRVGCHVARNTSTVKQKFDCTESILPISVKDETPLLVAKQSFNLDLRNNCCT